MALRWLEAQARPIPLMKSFLANHVFRCLVRVGETYSGEFAHHAVSRVREDLLSFERADSVHKGDGNDAGHNKEDRCAYHQGILAEELLAEHEIMVGNIHLMQSAGQLQQHEPSVIIHCPWSRQGA
jgi:hypothetical protein